MLISKNNTYKKIFITYTLVMLAIVIVLDSFFYTSIVNQVKQNNVFVNKNITEDVSRCIQDMSDISKLIKKSLYQTDAELRDTLSFLERDTIDYLRYRLDEYYKSDKITYNGVDQFVAKCYAFSPHLKTIAFLSYSQQRLTEFLQNGTNKSYEYKRNIPLEFETRLFRKEDTLTFIETIKNPFDFQEVGAMFISFDIHALDAILETDTINDVYILNSSSTVVYDSTKRLTNKKYPYIKEKIINKEELESLTGTYTNINYLDQGVVVIGQIEKRDAERLSPVVASSIFILGCIVFVFGEMILYLKLRKLNLRMKHILSAMEQVTQGNLEFKVQQTGKEKDELSIIENNFSKMCENLKQYIQKSYLAELNQKNAEMKALQSQINPHFLYNTLESIRMKAVCNGDKEVSKMLYNLAVIFRSQIKESNNISLAKELHYCKKYLELFRFRYENNFSFKIYCKEENYSAEIIKFTIQPILENYFIHGIRLDEGDNRIVIQIENDSKDLVISVTDNGKGMPQHEIDIWNERLQQCKYDGKSMGIANVHERIVMEYGADYGVFIQPNLPKGLKVCITIPNKRRDSYCTKS